MKRFIATLLSVFALTFVPFAAPAAHADPNGFYSFDYTSYGPHHLGFNGGTLCETSSNGNWKGCIIFGYGGDNEKVMAKVQYLGSTSATGVVYLQWGSPEYSNCYISCWSDFDSGAYGNFQPNGEVYDGAMNQNTYGYPNGDGLMEELGAGQSPGQPYECTHNPPPLQGQECNYYPAYSLTFVQGNGTVYHFGIDPTISSWGTAWAYFNPST